MFTQNEKDIIDFWFDYIKNNVSEREFQAIMYFISLEDISCNTEGMEIFTYCYPLHLFITALWVARENKEHVECFIDSLYGTPGFKDMMTFNNYMHSIQLVNGLEKIRNNNYEYDLKELHRELVDESINKCKQSDSQ